MTLCPCGKASVFKTTKVVKLENNEPQYKGTGWTARVPSYWCSVQCHNKGKRPEEKIV